MFAAQQQTSMVKLPASFWRFQTEARVLRGNADFYFNGPLAAIHLKDTIIISGGHLQ